MSDSLPNKRELHDYKVKSPSSTCALFLVGIMASDNSNSREHVMNLLIQSIYLGCCRKKPKAE